MRRLLSFALSFAMVVGLMPAPALAEAIDEFELVTQEEVAQQPVEEPPLEDSATQGDNAGLDDIADLSADVEVTEPEDADYAVSVQSDDEDEDYLNAIWLEALDEQTGSWTATTILNPRGTYRIQANDYVDEPGYDWTNSTDTLTFTPAPDSDAVYRVGHAGPFEVLLNEDHQTLDGLFYEEDGASLPLPEGMYRITFTGEDAYTYTTEEGTQGSDGEWTGLYTIEEGASYFFYDHYATDANGAFTRDSAHYYAQGTTTEQEGTINLNAPLDLEFQVCTAMPMGNTASIGSAGKKNAVLYMYKAQDGDSEELTLEELQTLFASQDLASWPSTSWWSNNAAHPNNMAWSRLTPTEGSNNTTWSFEQTDETTGTFSIGGIKLGEGIDTEPQLEEGVYFPVLRLNIDDEQYYYAYNPIEVAYIINERLAPTIVTKTLPDAMCGVEYASTLVGRTGLPADQTGTRTWAITSGSLPAGLTLNGSTGKISGMPTSPNTSCTFTITLTETAGGTPQTSSREYTIQTRDKVTLGSIAYSKQTIWIEDSDGATLHLSVPISADLTDSRLNLAKSEVTFQVYQTTYGSGSIAWGDAKVPVASVYNAATETLEYDAPISYTTNTIDRIVVNLDLWDNAGNVVMGPDAAGQSDWVIITSTVENPGITMGSYVYAPALEFESTKLNLPTEGRVRIWKHVEGNTSMPADAQEIAIDPTVVPFNDSFGLEPGTYVLTAEGKIPIYDDEGNETDEALWVDILGGITDDEPIAGTNPVQYKFSVGPNEGTRTRPKELGITYTDKNVPNAYRHRISVEFQQEDLTTYQAEDVSCDVVWYRRKGATEDADVMVSTGYSVELGPSPYDLYVQVIPKGRDSSFWKASEKVRVRDTDSAITVQVPRKGLFAGTFTLVCPDGGTPNDGENWGIIEVQTPVASGDHVSSNYWPTKTEGDGNTVRIPNLTSGSVVTFTPRVELKAGQVSYTVPENTTEDFVATLTAPTVDGLITFEGLTMVDVDGKKTPMYFDDGLTGVSITRVIDERSEVSVPFFIADGSSLILLPEQEYDSHNYYTHYENDVVYRITVTRRSADTQNHWGMTASNHAVRATFEVAFNQSTTKRSVAKCTLTSNGYANVPLSNPNQRLCTLLLYDADGSLVESGPAGKLKDLRTSFLEAGSYTLYAVDSDALPQDDARYATKAGLVGSTLSGENENRGSFITFDVTRGKATTASTLVFPSWTPSQLVNQAKSSVSVETVYAGTLSINMHAELQKGVTLGNNAFLEVSTNQETKENGGYLAPKALTLNGTSLALNRWDTLFCTGTDLVKSFTGNMEHGDLSINLDRVKELKASSASFPMDMTLVIPRVTLGYTDVSVWLVVNKGTKDERRMLVGSYQSDQHEATLIAPQVAAWKTFWVHGEAGPNANVTVFINGMRAATARADAYGYYEAEVTLPNNVQDFDEFKIYAAAQWTRGSGENSVGYAAVTSAASVLYSTSFPAVERVTMCYQSSPGELYHSMVAYDRGSQPSKYLTAYRAERDDKAEDGDEHAKHFWLIEFANGEDIASVQVGVRHGKELVNLTTTDSLSTAQGWIPDIAKAKENANDQDDPYQNLIKYGWYYSTAGSAAYAALQKNGTAGYPHAYATCPEYFVYSPEDMEISFELKDEVGLTDEDETLSLEYADATGPYRGWSGNKYAGEEVALTSDELSSFLQTAAAGGRLRLATQDDISGITNGTITSFDQLTGFDVIAQGLLNKPAGAIDEWLIVGNGDDTPEGPQELIKLHHTVSKTSMSKGVIRDSINTRLAAAKTVTDAYEDFWYNDKSPTTPVYYEGKWVVEAGGTRSTGLESMPYVIETMDDDGNVQVEWLQKYMYDDFGDAEDEPLPEPSESSNYSWCLTRADKYSYTITWWDEANGEQVTMSYELPSVLANEGRCSYTDVMAQWAIVFQCITAGVMDGSDLDALVGIQSSIAASAEPTGGLALFVQSESPKTKKPKEEKVESTWDKIEDFIRQAFSNPENESINYNLKIGERTDVTRYANDKDKVWDENKGSINGGTAAEASGIPEKKRALKRIAQEGTVEVSKDIATSLPAGKTVSKVQKGVSGVFWYQDKRSWVTKQLKNADPGKNTEEEHYKIFRYNRWLIKNKYKYGRPSKFYKKLLKMYDKKKLDEWEKRFWQDMETWKKDKSQNPGTKQDPSGMVYEAVLSNPVEGATVKLYTYNAVAAQNDLDPAQLMDSYLFGVEENPQVTGADGRYQWFVPEGFWQLSVTKDGYADFSTGDWGHEEEQPEYDDEGNQIGTKRVMVGDYGLHATKDLDGDGIAEASSYWMPVLPIQLDVNIPLVSYEAPVVQKVEADEAGAAITFSKYIKVDTVTVNRFKVAGKAPASVVAVDAEAAGNGSGDMLARTFRLAYASNAYVPAGKNVEVELADADGAIRSYANVSLKTRAEKQTTKVQDKGNVKHITVPKATNRTYNGKAQTGVAKGTGYTLSGTASATNAGTYKATAKLATGCMWADGTTASKTLTWNIARAKVNKPAAGAKLTYTGKTLTGVAAGTGYTRSGTYEAKAANKYTAYATPDANHCWPDGSVARITLSWQITSAKNTAKAKKTSVKKTFKRATVKKRAQTFSLPKVTTKFGAAKWKVSAKDKKKVLSLTKKGKIQVKKGAKKGTYTIKLKASVAKTANYSKATTKTVTVKVTIN